MTPHLRLVPDTDQRPWCPDIPEHLTVPVLPLEFATAELYARGLVTMVAFVGVCAGSQVRAGLALDVWNRSTGGRGL